MPNKKQNKADQAATQDHAETVSDADVKVVDVEDGIQDHKASSGGAKSEQTSDKTESSSSYSDSSSSSQEKVELNFTGSEMLRAKFPKPFEILETVATDWVNDGKFEGLPVGHPLAQYFAAKGLQKAKEVEKKVLESPVTEKVAMQAFTVGMKAAGIIQEVRSKMKNK